VKLPLKIKNILNEIPNVNRLNVDLNVCTLKKSS
jgi:hypothetical protein